MKTIFYILLCVNLTVIAQTKYITKTGTLNFEASVPSFEEVAAKNNSVTAILNTDNGEFAALAFVKAFRFKNALMEEHFNENYAESDTFPKATFRGKIEGFDLQSDNTSYPISGELTFHGKTKTYQNLKLYITKKGEAIILKGNFKVLVSDFAIEIPKIVRNKLSEEVDVTFNFELLEK
ncbi:YceI family protein [Ichthyenterobacterium sp. W332]|uniref:YceI family protein n=1 Tax=Microcosmobacter mediterraneus TaxID=3075607 RepID=A0ABU2YLK9_9FLAO|nr:YceI family protein [Ichthyenterobacterium sp. W332]MDT0558160.1 YceI family protein [Ichthyenterobacterium sp. W332]